MSTSNLDVYLQIIPHPNNRKKIYANLSNDLNNHRSRTVSLFPLESSNNNSVRIESFHTRFLQCVVSHFSMRCFPFFNAFFPFFNALFPIFQCVFSHFSVRCFPFFNVFFPIFQCVVSHFSMHWFPFFTTLFDFIVGITSWKRIRISFVNNKMKNTNSLKKITMQGI
jgi:hypothetical protein